MPAEVETMFYAGEVPWHGLGVRVEEAQTSAEAIRLAGLDWEVGLGPLYGPGYSEVEGRFSVYRKTDNKVLGICTGRYEPLQNAEAFEFVDSLLQDGVIRYETAGSLFGGRKIFLLASLAQDMRVGQDDYKPYLLLRSGHDLVTAVTVLPTTVRVVCNNTLQMALKGGEGIRVVHNGQLQERLRQAREILNITTTASRRLVEWLEKLTEIPAGYDVFQEVQEHLFGLESDATAQRRRAIELFQQVYTEELSYSGETAYALACAVTGYADHGRRYTGTNEVRAERRFVSVTSGGAVDFKDDGLLYIGKLVGMTY